MIYHDDNTIHSLVWKIVGPLHYTFVAWIIRDALIRNIKRLYFVSRDGQIWFKIANEFSKVTETPELRYLYGSRQAWHLPAITSSAKIPWRNWIDSPQTPSSILQWLGINIEEIEDILPANKFTGEMRERKLYNKEARTDFVRMLQKEEIVSIILNKASEARKVAIQYFKQEGLFEDSKWAIVDIGWLLTSIQSLRNILISNNYYDEFNVYYFGLNKDHIPIENIGSVIAFISETDGFALNNKKCPWLFNLGPTMVLEDIFCIADHAGVLRYGVKNNLAFPILRHNGVSNLQRQFANAIHSSILFYANNSLRTRNNPIDKLENMSLNAISSLEYFFDDPKIEYIKMINDIPITIQQSHDPKSWLYLRPISIREVIGFAIDEMMGTDKYIERHYWIQASLKLSSPIVRYLFGLLRHIKKILRASKSV